MQTVYVETTIPSYLISKPNRDIVILSHQQITREWWENSRNDYNLYISQIVLEEILMGESDYIIERKNAIKDIPLLDYNDEIEEIAVKHMNYFNFPNKVLRDMYHISYAVFYEMDFLLTWNCKHLANANLQVQLTKLNIKLGYKTPEICTPEELINIMED